MAAEFYRETLTKTEERDGYYALREGFLSQKKEISLPRLSYKALNDLCLRVRLDHPEIFYVGKNAYRATPGAEHVELCPEYLCQKKERERTEEAVGVRIRKMKEALTKGNPEELLLMKRIGEALFRSVRYESPKKPFAHEITGPLLHGIGVCEGIAKAVKILLDGAGVESVVAVGEEDGEGMRHAWNIVCVNGSFRHFDFTFDLNLVQKGEKSRYFALKDEKMYLDHERPVFPVPECR